MKYLKILIIFSGVFLFTGCNVTYNLEIKNNVAKEEVTMVKNNNLFETSDLESELASTILIITEDLQPLFGYDVSKVIGNKESGVKTLYEYPLIDLGTNSVMLERCYDKVTTTITAESVSIVTTNKFKCWSQIDGTLTVNIKTDYNVVNHNADSVNGTTYTWNMSESDTDNTIILDMEESTNPNNKVNKNLIYISINGQYLAFILAGITIISIIIFFVIRNKYNNNNKI